MSCQKGNVARTRPQRHQNKSTFKNDLHDSSRLTKNLNKIEVVNVCARCKGIIEWKIKFKKYKPLKNPATCVSCHNKCVKHAYHNFCNNCALNQNVCPKCGEKKELVESSQSCNQEDFLKNTKVKALLHDLTERKRRMFYRYLNRAESSSLGMEEVLQKLESITLESADSASAYDDSSDEYSSDPD